jgi:hypothetical protein
VVYAEEEKSLPKRHRFSELNKPLRAGGRKSNDKRTMPFAPFLRTVCNVEMRVYLDTHPGNKEAAAL